jgi:transmembrane sensor
MDMKQSADTIDLVAAEWAVRLLSRKLTADEKAELDTWMSADPRHAGALLRAQAAWVDLDRLTALAGGAIPEGSGPAQIDEAQSKAPPVPSRINRDFGQQMTSRRSLLAAGLTSLAVLAGGAWWFERHQGRYVSQVGEIRRVTLQDGSQMVLNTATEATVRFDKTLRVVELSTGEGLFEVAKDAKRPFIVRADKVSVRAVGTVFSVRKLGSRVDVIVTEGVVEIRDDASGSVRRVTANHQATMGTAEPMRIAAVAPIEAERHLAWRDGMVDFAGERLSVAVAEMNRHNEKPILIDDPSLRDRPVVGLFRASDPASFARTVAAALAVESTEESDGIHLRPIPNQ